MAVLADDVKAVLFSALTRVLDSTPLGEVEYERLTFRFTGEAKVCPPPRLWTDLVLDDLPLEPCMGARVSVNFSEFCDAYDEFVREAVVDNHPRFKAPQRFFAKALGIPMDEARFYFFGTLDDAAAVREKRNQMCIPALAQSALVSFEGAVVMNSPQSFAVECGDRVFGIHNRRVLTETGTVRLTNLVSPNGCVTQWKPGKLKEEVGLADNAYEFFRTLPDRLLPLDVRPAVLEAVSIIRWMSNPSDFAALMRGVNKPDRGSAKVEQLRLIEMAQGFESFEYVTRDTRSLLVPSVIDGPEFRAKFGPTAYQTVAGMPHPVWQRWKENLTQLHRRVSAN